MKIILCYPPFMDPAFGPPIGILYLASVLKEQGHEVVVKNVNPQLLKLYPKGWVYKRNFELPPEQEVVTHAYQHIHDYCNDILSEKPDVVGFSLLYCNYKFGIQMARILSPRVRCIAGGPQCTFHPQDILKLGCFRAVVSGYGEEAIFDALYNDGIFSKELLKNKEYLPDYSFISLSDYNGLMPIVTTRGCPFHCNFCTQHQPYHYQEITSVVHILKNSQDAKRIIINDSNLNLNPTRTKELFEQLASLKNKVPISVFGMQVVAGVENYAHLMAETGVTDVQLGVESGSLRERNSMDKQHYANELVVTVTRELTRCKITAYLQYIFCYPDQTEEDRQQTVAFMNDINQECGTEHVGHRWYQFVIHNGTEEFFKTRHGVFTTSPNTWENALYNPGRIREIANEYKKIIPKNCHLFVD